MDWIRSVLNLASYELEFLNRLEESMAIVLPNGETVGAGIRELNLSVYGCKAILDPARLPSSTVTASSFPLVSRLINQCPNTTSLALRGIESEMVLEDPHRKDCGKTSWFPSVLNENGVCNGVMENLVDLSLRDMKKILSTGRPIINFNRLTTLKLDDCSIQVKIWAEFLLNVPTLENLHMIGVKGVFDEHDDDLEWWRPHPNVNGLEWILPISMPHLKSLEIVSIEYHHFICQCNKAFVDNLMGCPEIRRVHLSLDQKSIDEESMERLARMNIDLTVKAGLGADRIEDIRDALDSSSKFKVVRIFHERMDSFGLHVGRKWSPELSTALEDVINSCSNLTTFALHIPDKSYKATSDATEIEPVEMKRINAAMIRFFGNQERAMQLKDLRLWGNFDEAVILSAFESCLNLNRLEIMCCPAIRDQHLINWVSNGGGNLKYLRVFRCQNFTSEGIIPILAKSGEGFLSRYVFTELDSTGEERNLQTALKRLRPYAQC